MKPEQVAAIMHQAKIAEDATKELDRLLSARNKTPEVSRRKYPVERYKSFKETVLGMIRNPHPYGTPHIQGATPNLLIITNHNGAEVSLCLKFEASEGETEDYLTAVWTSRDKSIKLPPHKERVSRDMAFYSHLSTKDYKKAFNDFEWSLTQYLDAVAQLTPEQLAKHEFPQPFIDQMVASRTEA